VRESVRRVLVLVQHIKKRVDPQAMHKRGRVCIYEWSAYQEVGGSMVENENKSKNAFSDAPPWRGLMTS
jgi:hypothetical protein